MLSILCVRLTIKVNVGTPESFKVGWYPEKKTGSSHLNSDLDNSTWLKGFGLETRPSPLTQNDHMQAKL